MKHPGARVRFWLKHRCWPQRPQLFQLLAVVSVAANGGIGMGRRTVYSYL
jgi:hypothetical protein